MTDVWRPLDDLPDPDLSESPAERAAAKFYAELGDAEPAGAIALSDPSGRWFYAACRRCSPPWRTMSTQRWRDKAAAERVAAEHNRERHPELLEEEI